MRGAKRLNEMHVDTVGEYLSARFDQSPLRFHVDGFDIIHEHDAVEVAKSDNGHLETAIANADHAVARFVSVECTIQSRKTRFRISKRYRRPDHTIRP